MIARERRRRDDARGEVRRAGRAGAPARRSTTTRVARE